MNGLIEELKRRNVFRVGVAYVVVSWLIVQVVDTISDPLNLPEWLDSVVVVLLLAGFPIAALLAWAYELTPEGVKRTADVELSDSVTADTGRKLNYAIIATLGVALAIFAYDRQRLVEKVERSQAMPNPVAEEVESTETRRASIAVLPFVNMSDDESQEHFSDGISEELLNVLANVPEFKVAARTSSFQFKGRTPDIADVGSQLNVAHVLEGSVRKAGNTVRITAQLIEVDSGFHVWSESYDRQLDDIFAIQDEISGAIVAALSETLGLSSGEISPITAQATSDENYNDYLLARELIRQREEISLTEARGLLQRVSEDDPDYAPALVQLALAWYLLSDTGQTYGSLPISETIPVAVDLVDKALLLTPDDPEALGVKGLVNFDDTGDGEASLEYLRRSLELNPSQTDVRTWYSNSLMFSARYEEANRQLAIGLEYDPLSMLLLMNYSYRLIGTQDVDRLQPILDRIDRLDPARASSLRASLAETQGRMAESVVHFIEAMEHAPGETRYRLDLGFQFLRLGLVEEARLQLTGPEYEFWLLFNNSDFEGALKVAEAQMNAAPEAFAIRYSDNVASALFRLGNYSRVIEMGPDVIEQMPEEFRDHHWMNYEVAASMIVEGESDRAVAYLERFVTATESDIRSNVFAPPRRYFGVAQAHAALGNDDMALQRFTYAAERAAFKREWLSPLVEHMEQDSNAAYSAVFDLADQRFAEENALFREAVCIDGRFNQWRPLASTCNVEKSEAMPEAAEST
ncbi:MAG: adenylyl cyclase [Pseudomonadota bacterium]